jgi:hypothetical protein
MVSIAVFWSVEDNVTMIRIGYQGVLSFEIAPRPIDLILTPRKYINPPCFAADKFPNKISFAFPLSLLIYVR